MKTLKSNYYKVIFLIIFLIFNDGSVNSQENSIDQRVFLITIDGLRWQEVFNGADSLLIRDRKFSNQPRELSEVFWRENYYERRKVLLPFIWNTVSKIGQIHGNRTLGSKVNLTNKLVFSYPGYNEILTGRADDKNITSNSKIPNDNITVLEDFAMKYTKNKVAAFASWDVFDFIINEERSGVYTNCGFEPSYNLPLTNQEILINELQSQTPSPWVNVRLDGFTHQFAKEFIRKNKPDLIYIAYGETDDFAHGGDYSSYLKSSLNTDNLIEDLWNYTQEDEYYKDKTTFIITTDHGRGTIPLDSWTGHGANISGADQTWIIAFGKGVTAKGEIDYDSQFFSNQIAPYIRQIMNIKQKKEEGYGIPINFN